MHNKDTDAAKLSQTVTAEFLVTAYYVPPEKLQPPPPEEDDKKGKGKKGKGKKGGFGGFGGSRRCCRSSVSASPEASAMAANGFPGSITMMKSASFGTRC